MVCNLNGKREGLILGQLRQSLAFCSLCLTHLFLAKADGFLPGGASFHNCMTPHGPDTKS